MKVGILPFVKERRLTGVNRMTQGIIRELLRQNREHSLSLLANDNWMDLDIHTIPVVPAYRNPVPLNYTVAANHIDIIHSFFFPFELSHSLPCAKILTIYDMIRMHVKWSTESEVRLYDGPVRQCAADADLIMTDSEFTKSEIIHFYGLSESKIKVVYGGLYTDGNHKSSVCHNVDRFISDDGYLLAVSAVHAHKNQSGMIRAFMEFKRKNPDNNIKLILVGSTGLHSGLLESVQKDNPGFEKHVMFTGYVSDEELTWLYENALAFICPSFMEGFGLPVLEAMSKGVPVMCSDTSSLPEVGGEAVRYFNPYDTDSMVDAMEYVLLDDSVRKDLAGRALVQASKFSYQKAAKQILEIYNIFR